MTTYGLVGLVFINLAIIIYTIGVWSERFQGRLKWWHVGMFYSVLQFNFHGITGLAAILIMLFHAGWATLVLINKNEVLIVKFHKFSFVVWIIWLIPMVTGAVFGATR